MDFAPALDGIAPSAAPARTPRRPWITDPTLTWIADARSGWQDGEQGVLAAIVEQLGLSGTCVELGAGDGAAMPVTCDQLIQNGWTAVLVEIDGANVAKLRERYQASKYVGVSVRHESAVPENADQYDADVFVIDVDGTEFHLWSKIGNRAAVVVVEHRDIADNAFTDEAYVPDIDRAGQRAGQFCDQATWAALDALAESKGYAPVARTRYNSFYVKSELVDKLRREPVKPSGEIRLDIGGGSKSLPGYVNIDRKIGREAFPLPYDDNTVSEIRASHILEHFGFVDTERALKEWFRVLKPGGVMRVAVPDVRKMAEMIVANEPGEYINWLYGGQTDADDFHRNGFDEHGLTAMLKSVGLVSIERWTSDADDCAKLPISLNLQGIKPTVVRRSMCAMMSTPRLIHKHNYLSVINAVIKRGVSFRDYGGAYWHQGMERLIRENWDDYEWILTIDYDTQFDERIMDRLSVLFELHPEADALAPLQAKREAAGLIANMEINSPEDLLKDVVPAKSAHFGFTFFRTASLKKFAAWCKARGEPMMLEKPTPDCDWGEDRIDADMNFWYRFKEAGFKLFVTPRVGVGHLEELGVWVGEDFKPVYQPVSKFQNDGPPLGARR